MQPRPSAETTNPCVPSFREESIKCGCKFGRKDADTELDGCMVIGLILRSSVQEAICDAFSYEILSSLAAIFRKGSVFWQRKQTADLSVRLSSQLPERRGGGLRDDSVG